MNDHPTGEQLALYAMDALDAEASQVLESHVSLCVPCGAALAKEAQLEVALAQTGQASVPSVARFPPRSNQRSNLRWAFASAASLLLLLGGARSLFSSRDSVRSDPARSSAALQSFASLDAGALAIHVAAARTLEMAVACLDAKQLDECLKSSREQGRMVQLPAQPVPKYEELALDAPHPAPLGAWQPLAEGE